MKSSTHATNSPKGWVLYDDSCGLCSRWVPLWTRTFQKLGYAVAPLQSDWVRDRLHLDEASLLEDIRLLLADGSQICGAEVYRFFLRRIWWAYPIYFLSLLPGFRQLFNWSYRAFARNRFRFSRACGVAKPSELAKQKP